MNNNQTKTNKNENGRRFRLCIVLMMLALLTFSLAMGTMARYSTTGTSGAQSARVAKFGVTITATDDSAFETEYTSENGNTITVRSSTNDKIVAPGTSDGGVSSIIETGGTGNVPISGGTVTARSTSAIIDFETTPNITEAFVVSPSTAIGGGFRAKKEGGSTTVTVSGGTIVSDGIGGGFSDVNGYSNGTVTITGGSLNSYMAAIPTNGTSNGSENVFLTTVSFVDGTLQQEGKLLTSLTTAALARTGISYYGLNDLITDRNGIVYLWLPANIGVTGAKLDDSKTYEAIYEDDGIIDSKDVGMLLTEGSERQYIASGNI